MPTSSWRTRLSVIERLSAQPGDFSFTQAVRLLERAALYDSNGNIITTQKSSRGNQPVARFAPPNREIVRFATNPALVFPETEIEVINTKADDENNRQWQIVVSFIGLVGAMGIMPFHYTEMILKRLKLKDPSLNAFLGLFTHRTTSLFFQASSKYRLPLEYERSKLHQTSAEGNSAHTQLLLSMLGLGTKGLRERQSLRDESLIYYSGLFTQQVKTPSGLCQIIESYFGVPAEVEGFIGQWQELIDDVRTRLPWKANKKGQNVCLGRSSMLGKRGWFAQGKSRVKIGPLNKEQFETFAPGTGALKSLNEIVTTYLGMEQNFDFVIEVNRDEVPSKIALERANPPTLAWNSWLSGKPKTNTEKDELLEIRVSSKRLN